MKLPIRTSVGAVALSVALLGGIAPAEATNQGTRSGVESEQCVLRWQAATVLDADLTNDDPEYPNLMVNLAGEPVDYTNGGYISAVMPALKGPGILEINHFYYGRDANLVQVWRIPTATTEAVSDATVTFKLPPEVAAAGHVVTFDATSTNDRMSGWGEPYSAFTWAEAATAVDNRDGTWTVKLGDMAANSATVYQFNVAIGAGAVPTDRFVASATLSGTYAAGGNGGECPAPEPTPTPTPTPTPSKTATPSPTASASSPAATPSAKRKPGLPKTGD